MSEDFEKRLDFDSDTFEKMKKEFFSLCGLWAGVKASRKLGNY